MPKRDGKECQPTGQVIGVVVEIEESAAVARVAVAVRIVAGGSGDAFDSD